MELHAVNSKYLAFSVPSDEIIGEKEARELVNRILGENELPCWEKISIEMFSGKEGALYLAHPLPRIKISVAPILRPFLNEYFTE